MTYYIYGIYDQHGNLRYIGQTKQQPDKRFKQHLNQIANCKRGVKTKTKPSTFHKTIAQELTTNVHQEILATTTSKKKANMVEAYLILRELLEIGNDKLCNAKLDKMWLDKNCNWENHLYI